MISALGIAIELSIRLGEAQQVEFSFETSLGTIDFLADVSVVKDVVVFTDACIYPREPAANTTGWILTELLKQRRALLDAIGQLGWTSVEIRADRVANSSSANPGKSVRLMRKVNP
jgi:hypothetical protein